MKHSILILAMLFLISSCNSDEDGLITENATIYYDVNTGKRDFSISYCYLIEIESNKVLFMPKTPHSLSNLNIKSNSSSKVKVTYRLTEDKVPPLGDQNGCRHFDRVPTALIEVICIEKIK